MNSQTRETRYTSRYHFAGDYKQAVVERSCSALSILLQNVFSAVEKQLLADMEQAESVAEQNQYTEALAELLVQRHTIEATLVHTMMAAYAEMEGEANFSAIDAICQDVSGRIVDPLNLFSVFSAESIIDDYTNRNRPLLIYLSAQLHGLFAIPGPHIDANPLSPRTVTVGFLLGLQCADMDITGKLRLLHAFESEFLGQLSTLLNNVVSRLEQEEINVAAGVAFNENSGGPMEQLYEQLELLAKEDLHKRLGIFTRLLDGAANETEIEQILELANEESVTSTVNCLSQAQRFADSNNALAEHLENCREENLLLSEARKKALAAIDESLQGKALPAGVIAFFQTAWADLLFSVILRSGEGSEEWQQICDLQQELLGSVIPIDSDQARTELSRRVPGLIHALRDCLERHGFSSSHITRLLNNLKEVHLQNLQKKLGEDALESWQPLLAGVGGDGIELASEVGCSRETLDAVNDLLNFASA